MSWEHFVFVASKHVVGLGSINRSNVLIRVKAKVFPCYYSLLILFRIWVLSVPLFDLLANKSPSKSISRRQIPFTMCFA